jgi:hypothetical protein
VRGSTIHLWYTGFNGARASIGYAVGVQHNAQSWTWQPFGQVLEATVPWESRRVLAPSVVVLPSVNAPIDSGIGIMHLWYESGTNDRERIGMVSRELPARLAHWSHDR